jgi:hypothetical protein
MEEVTDYKQKFEHKKLEVETIKIKLENGLITEELQTHLQEAVDSKPFYDSNFWLIINS